MKIFNESKTKELAEVDIDFERGYLTSDRQFVAHHEAVQAVEEQGHYETIREYPNGGKDLEWVVDVEEVEAKEAWDEYEDIQVFVPFKEVELANREIMTLKVNLANSDYQSVRDMAQILLVQSGNSKANITEVIQRFADNEKKRQEWRNRINELENKLKIEEKTL